MAAWELRGCRCPTSEESAGLHIASPGKDQNAKCVKKKKSKFKVWFLLNAGCFSTTVKSKNLKSNHRTSAIICII